MLVERFAENPIIKPCDVPPSRDDYEVVGAFNPAATIFNDEILLLLRVAERPKDKNPDEQGLMIGFSVKRSTNIAAPFYKNYDS